MKNKIIRNILTICFLANISILYGQFTQPFLRKIGKNEGLTGSLVLSLAQDSRNLFWIGTLNGLQQFDGKLFKKIPVPIFQNDIYGSNSISNLLIGNDSTLWITNYQGIAKFNLYTHIFELIPVPKESPTQTIAFTGLFKDSASHIWATSFEMGLIKYNAQKNIFEKIPDDTLKDLKRLKAQITSIQNNLILYHKNGVDMFDTKSNKFLNKNNIAPIYSWMKNHCFEGEIYDLFDDTENVYALIWNSNKVQYDLIIYNKSSSTCKVHDLKSVAGRKFFKDSNNNLWIYGDGIDVIPNGSTERVSIKENIKEGRSIDFTMCHKMFEDNEHNIWFCTNAGFFVFNINEKNFKICNEQDENGYIKHLYNSILETSNKDIWIGTFGEGLLILDEELLQKKHIDFEKTTEDKQFNLIWCILETNDTNEIWLGCQKGRLINYNKQTQKYTYYNDTCFEQKTIMSIIEDVNGNLYFGTYGGSIIKKPHKSNAFELFYKSNQLKARTAAGVINDMIIINNELIAATQYDGIVSININTKKIRTSKMDLKDPLALKSNNVFCFLKTEGENYLVGTSNGLGHYVASKKGFDFYTMYDGLPFSNVYNLIDIEKGEMIASTSDGLYKTNWNLKSFERIEKNANLYKGFNFIYRKKNGKSLLLGDDEYLYLLPIANNVKKTFPLTHIYTVRSFDKTFFIKPNQKNLLLFDKNHNTINIDFGASSFTYYNSVDYYYMLDGVDNDWIYAGNNRTITYNNLKSSHYKFQLKCIFQEDKKLTQILNVEFEIEKPFNQSIWFYLIIVMSCIGLLYVFYRIRLNKFLAIEKIRFDLSKDLHDDMGSTLSTINILSVIAENKIEQDKSMSQHYLKRINQISQEMMQNMDDIVWSINPNNDNMGKVVVRMREFAAEILEPLNINLRFEVDNAINTLETKMRWRRDFYLIFKEAVNNSAKYSGCKNVHIHIQIQNKKLQLLIKDDGSGFDEELSKMGNGLINMTNRARNIGGEINIETKLNQGTQIQLLIPLNKI